MSLDEAIDLATQAHAGQTDQAGHAYIDHPLSVMAAIDEHDSSARMAAVLHDVLEDTAVTVEDLRHAGCPDDVLGAVVALTRQAAESYADFLARLSTDRIALKVKLADVADNSDPARLALLPPEIAARLREKYQRAQAALEILGAPTRHPTSRG